MAGATGGLTSARQVNMKAEKELVDCAAGDWGFQPIRWASITMIPSGPRT